MVTDEERDYMYRVYAHDPQMRINLGIRRRLAPLLNNNRRRIELLNGLLMSMPGTPVLYYGDEIGMGDNVYLGDRNGVRTPMQWAGDRNAGFSTANRQRLYLPVITDPEYHYEAINVETQQNNAQSLLWWMKRLIALRKNYRAFGRGSLKFLHPDNRRIVAFIREFEDERILVVANLSRFVQYADLDLSEYRGMTPVEMFGRVEFPRIEDRPLFLTLAPHGFIWFALESDPSGRGGEVRGDGDVAPTLRAPAALDALLTGKSRGELTGVLPAYLRARRWFRSKARRIKGVSLYDHIPVAMPDGAEARLAMFDVEYNEGEPERYVLPLALARGEDAERVTRVAPQALVAYVQSTTEPAESPPWLLYDALYDSSFGKALLDQIAGRRRLDGRRGQVTATPTRAFKQLRGGSEESIEPTVGRAEQSNTSIVFGQRFILKVFRRLEPGINPDLEIGSALTEQGFPYTPAVGGWLAYRTSREEPSALGILQQFAPNEGDVWEFTLDAVNAFFERVAAREEPPADVGSVSVAAVLNASSSEPTPETVEAVGAYLDVAELLGTRTAQLHKALATPGDNVSFVPEPFSALYQRSVFQTMRNNAKAAIALLDQVRGDLPEAAQPLAERAAQLGPTIVARMSEITRDKIGASRIRVHGDFHAGQVLWTGRDFVFIDFEGEPGRPLSERRHKKSAMVDVAGMLRSFHYAAFGTLLNPRVGGTVRAEDLPQLEPWANLWYLSVASSFLRAYLEEAEGQPFVPADRNELVHLLEASALQKVLYELTYELNNRPDWVTIPLRGLVDLVGEARTPS